MKKLLYIILAILALFAVAKLTDYEGRMQKYNKYMCANYGYYEDCKTPLAPEDRLK